MKKVLVAIIITAVALAAVGCMSPEEKEAQNQVINYIDSMANIEIEKNTVINNIMTIENSDSDIEILKIISEDILPVAENINQELSAIEPANEEIGEVHQYFVRGWTQLTNGLTGMKESLENSDLTTAEKGGAEVKASQETLTRYYEELSTLCDKYKIEMETEIHQDSESIEQ